MIALAINVLIFIAAFVLGWKIGDFIRTAQQMMDDEDLT